MRGSIGRRPAVFVPVAATAVGVVVASTPAHAGGASTQSTWNVLADDLMKSTESNPWPLECLGGPRKDKVFYLPAFADQDFECSVPARAKVLALPRRSSAGRTTSHPTPRRSASRPGRRTRSCRRGDHVVVTSFAYAGGFAGTNTYTLHVG